MRPKVCYCLLMSCLGNSCDSQVQVVENAFGNHHGMLEGSSVGWIFLSVCPEIVAGTVHHSSVYVQVHIRVGYILSLTPVHFSLQGQL